LSLDTIDVTAHDSPSGFREFIAGLADAGEVTIEMIFDPDNATQALLRTDLTSRTATTYTVTMSEPTTPQTWAFTGIVTAFEPSAPVDGALTVSVTIKITGVVTVT
jgi:predicted secreted protein